MSQNDLILEHLKRHGLITPISALHQYGCFRLAARISDLRACGHSIETHIRKDNGKRFAVYTYHSKARSRA